VNHILVAALCLIPALASAWEPGELIDLPGTGDASVLHLGRLGDQPALVAAGPGGVFIVQNGAIVASDSQPASDAALLGGSVWTCAEDGIRRLDLSLEGFRAVELVVDAVRDAAVVAGAVGGFAAHRRGWVAGGEADQSDGTGEDAQDHSKLLRGARRYSGARLGSTRRWESE